MTWGERPKSVHTGAFLSKDLMTNLIQRRNKNAQDGSSMSWSDWKDGDVIK